MSAGEGKLSDAQLWSAPAGDLDGPFELTLQPTIEDHVALARVMRVDARFRAMASRAHWISAAVLGLAGAYFQLRGVPVVPVAWSSALGR